MASPTRIETLRLCASAALRFSPSPQQPSSCRAMAIVWPMGFLHLQTQLVRWYAWRGWRRWASAGTSVSEEGPDSTTGVMPGNARPRQREGKCRRKQTAPGWPGVRVKGCGKSAPPLRKRRGHGKPHAEQGRIGGLRVACPRIPPRVGEVPGLAARAAW